MEKSMCTSDRRNAACRIPQSVRNAAIIFLGLGVLVSHAQAQTVVMLGDSTTQSNGSKPGAKLTDCVQANLLKHQIPATVINSGKGGDTAKGACTRLAKDVFAHKPSVVTISFGLNDTGKSTPKEYRASMEQLIQSIQMNTQAKIVLVTSTPFIDERHIWRDKFSQQGGIDRFLDANMCAAMRDLAREQNLPLCDLHAHFLAAFKKDPALRDELIVPDGVHLSDRGNELAAGFVSEEIVKLLR
ncbi:MAG: GDSL-type esterase/lipase family protein [Pirellulales bacterium]